MSHIRIRHKLYDKGDEGFTLIEMLCVLVIIGLMTGVAAMSLRAPNSPEAELSDTLLPRFNHAAKDAIFTGQSRALSVTEQSIYILRFTDNQWQVDFEQPLEDGLSARISVADEVLKLPKKPVPMVLFDPTGEVDEFVLAIRGLDEPLIFSARQDGIITLGLDR